jgi:oxygen-independent coproporphyrinogen-3 oxidase
MKDTYLNGSPEGQQPTDLSGGLLAESCLKCLAGLYIHIPFCFHKCHYCDFYSIVDRDDRQEAFLARLLNEWRSISHTPFGQLRTIFVGGGTPTLLRVDLWELLLADLRQSVNLDGLAEFTVEANPETVEPALVAALVDGGVNRMSMGAQSFDPTHLKTLERWHDPASVPRAVTIAREAGIEQISLDLIFAIPGQSLDDWKQDLEKVVALEPDHLSCYALTYEPNTPMTQKVRMGRTQPVDVDLEAEMFEWTMQYLAQVGYEQYEVSSYARPGRQCQHNLMYWHNEDWFTLGPSASGHLAGVRWKNVPHLGKYLASNGSCPVQDVERLSESKRLGERLMLGLRLRDGIDVDPDLLDESRTQVIARSIETGWMERDGFRLRLTQQGLMVADSILSELI